MELTEVQRELLDFLRASKVNLNNIIMIFLLMKDNELDMKRLIVYIYDNRPTSDQIIKKAVEMAKAWDAENKR